MIETCGSFAQFLWRNRYRVCVHVLGAYGLREGRGRLGTSGHDWHVQEIPQCLE
jgi:hypothetical protein